MTYSCFTLAALAVSTLPSIDVVQAAEVGREAGIFTTLITLRDQKELVVRCSKAKAPAALLRREANNLQRLGPGLRSRLPFMVPTLLAENCVNLDQESGYMVIIEQLPGFALTPDQIQPGRGAAESIGGALAAIHNLPASSLIQAGFSPVSSAECRNQADDLVERAAASRLLPLSLRQRWRDLVHERQLWEFTPGPVKNFTRASSFRFHDDQQGGAAVLAVGDWQNLAIGDPAIDLFWLNDLRPDAANSVYNAYNLLSSGRRDPRLYERARFWAELDVARWLLTGIENGDEEIISSAARTLEQMVDSLGRQASPSLITPEQAVEKANRLLSQTPGASKSGDKTGLLEPEPKEVLKLQREDRAKEF